MEMVDELAWVSMLRLAELRRSRVLPAMHWQPDTMRKLKRPSPLQTFESDWRTVISDRSLVGEVTTSDQSRESSKRSPLSRRRRPG